MLRRTRRVPRTSLQILHDLIELLSGDLTPSVPLPGDSKGPIAGAAVPLAIISSRAGTPEDEPDHGEHDEDEQKEEQETAEKAERSVAPCHRMVSERRGGPKEEKQNHSHRGENDEE